jgi:hypothetical protein
VIHTSVSVVEYSYSHSESSSGSSAGIFAFALGGFDVAVMGGTRRSLKGCSFPVVSIF